MIDLDSIVGHGTARTTLARLVEGGRVPHALLFHGPPGVGKATTALAFAAILLCEQAGGSRCGTCEACRMVERNNHPDLLRVSLLSKDDRSNDERRQLMNRREGQAPGDLRSEILVDQVRTLNRLVGLTPRAAERRVFIVDPADRLRAEGQNALLKTLEEPPPRSMMILVAARPHVLLPTVRSRCFSLGFSPLHTDELATLLTQRGVAPPEARLRAALAAGRVGAALELDVEDVVERRRELLEALCALAEERPAAVARLADTARALAGANEPATVLVIDMLQGLVRDASRLAAGMPVSTIVHADVARELETLGTRLGAARAARIVAATDRVRGTLRFNVNRQLAVESLLASLAGAPVP